MLYALNNFEVVAASLSALLIFRGRIPLVLVLGFVAYGLSIYFYVSAQRHLGAAKTSAYYAVAPFIGVLLPLVIFRELPSVLFWLALAVMIAATVLVSRDQSTEDA